MAAVRWLSFVVMVACASACNHGPMPPAICECMTDRDCVSLLCVGCKCEGDRVMDLAPPADLALPCGWFCDCCGGRSCVDFSVDRANWGHCGIQFPPTVAGLVGKCAGCINQSLTLRNGACVDTKTDARNCGGCGKVCPFGVTCVGGTCVGCQAGLTGCTGACLN